MLTDMVLEKIAKQKASFVVCPCCVGQMKHEGKKTGRQFFVKDENPNIGAKSLKISSEGEFNL